ncbi:MAG: RNA polymerase subunit sigma [Clostridia bacterium]|nr:RNA polymerase subunit sigma [Clostridia bacterium]
MREIDELAIKAASDDKAFSKLVEDQKHFIINCTFKATRKYVRTSDDEWSIALSAFYDAVKSYDESKGGFLPYAELMIKRKLIDYYRTGKKYASEYLVNPSVFEAGPNEENEDIGLKIEITEKLVENTDYSLKDEIEAANAELMKFGFSFFDLADCSPKSQKTKEACKKAVLYILDNNIIMGEIYSSKQLPLKVIQKNTDLPRKILENYRRYIIAAIEILSGEYPGLAGYISYIRKDGN